MARSAAPLRKEQAKQIQARNYNNLSVRWDRYWVPAHAAIRERLVTLARLKAGERVLDVGTGTGAMAFLAAKRVGNEGHVLGVDNAERMVAVAQQKRAKLHLADVDFREMDTVALPLRAASFDVVVSSFGMPDLPSDVPTALGEVYRVLKPGGRLSFCEHAARAPVAVVVDQVLAKYRVKHPSPALATHRRAEVLLENEHKRLRSLYWSNASTVRALVREAEFRAVRVLTETFAVSFPSVQVYLEFALAERHPEYAALARNVQKDLRREAIKALGPFQSARGLSWQRQVNFCSARK